MSKLSIPIRMLLAFNRFAVCLQTIPRTLDATILLPAYVCSCMSSAMAT
jgi:hypothetical protein